MNGTNRNEERCQSNNFDIFLFFDIIFSLVICDVKKCGYGQKNFFDRYSFIKYYFCEETKFLEQFYG